MVNALDRQMCNQQTNGKKTIEVYNASTFITNECQFIKNIHLDGRIKFYSMQSVMYGHQQRMKP